MAKKITSAESRARAYTSSELKRLGWNTKHPNSGGNILEEQEAKNYDERFNELLGKDRPDFLIYKDGLPIGIIECKNEKSKIESAIDQGIGYSDKLSKKYFNVRIAIGVSGNEEDGVVVRSLYKLDGGDWEKIKGNGYPLTQLLSEKQLEQVLLNKKPSIDLEIPTESDFYEVAEKINKIMHEAKVNKSDRAVYLASIILAMQEGDVDTRPNVILEQINANVESALRKKNKSSLKHI
jgi:type I restriction enzyme M protein